MKENKSKTKISFFFLVLSVVFQAISLAFYWKTGLTEFTAEYSSAVFYFGIAALLLGFILMISNIIPGRKKFRGIWIFIVYLLGLLAWLFYITSEVNYIVNILVSIDGTKLTSTFILTVVFFAISWMAALISSNAYKAPQKEMKKLKRRG